MRILVVGVNHDTGPLEVRERLTFPHGGLGALLTQLRRAVSEGFILSTCNRSEVYAAVRGSPAAESLLRFLAERSGLDVAIVRDACYVHTDDVAARHALHVASGLDSLVLGEDQIQGQMRRALAAAREAGMLGAVLERLGSSALACGKRVRTFTEIGRHTVSLESLAVRALVERMDALVARHAVVIGAGESASLLVRHLRAAGIGRITIASRTLDRAVELARSVGADACGGTDLPAVLIEADVVFGCTSSPHPVVTPASLEPRRAARADAPLLCIDLGMPRDVHESVASLSCVSVVTLDELAIMAQAHRAALREHLPAAESIVTAEADRFMQWLHARQAVPVISGLNARANLIAEREVHRALGRLPSLSAAERAVVEELAHRIARKLMHLPISALKQTSQAESLSIASDQSGHLESVS